MPASKQDCRSGSRKKACNSRGSENDVSLCGRFNWLCRRRGLGFRQLSRAQNDEKFFAVLFDSGICRLSYLGIESVAQIGILQRREEGVKSVAIVRFHDLREDRYQLRFEI